MKIPVIPPNFEQYIQSTILAGNSKYLLPLIKNNDPVDDRGRYLHWDKLRHLPAPDGLSSEQWWFKLKMARRNMSSALPLVTINGASFNFAVPDSVQRDLHWLDRYTAGTIGANDAITNAQTRNTYLIQSLIEEAINSSQLEGASTTRDVAREMIRQERTPRDKSEQMVLNNYQAMRFIHEIKADPLTPAVILELHTILTQDTLPVDQVGRLRAATDDIHVVDRATQKYLHTPPPAKQLPERLQALCDFANGKSDTNGVFMHPVIRAITLHFMLAYDHPFCDGNGRTARALFYWSMANQKYWLMEFISISRIIKLAPAKYGQAFLYTETDDNDVSYFILHQLAVIRQAVDDLQVFLERKMQGIQESRRLLVDNPRLHGKLNFRQLALLRHALKHPRFSYVVQEHQQSHGVSYDVARKDLLEMADELKLLIKSKQGRRYYFVVPNDLEDRIARQ